MAERSQRISEIIERVAHELAQIRGGRATPAIVEDLAVDCYGTTMTLKQVSSVTVADPRTLAITPWDKTILPQVAKAIERGDLGAMPSIHGETIHVTLPPLTQERRQKLRKVVGNIIEEGRIALRRLREEEIERLRESEAQGELSEDAFFRERSDLEEEIEEANERLAALRAKKEQELLGEDAKG